MLEFREVTEPYPGLRPFETWEGEIFFGREDHINRLLEILQREHFLAVIGPSGSGKSSLVRAGLLPTLPLGSIGTGSDWRIAILKPGNRPIQRLASALFSQAAIGHELVGKGEELPAEGHITSAVALVEAELRRGPLGLIHVADAAARSQASRSPPGSSVERFNLLILVDQFEELFTHAEAGERQADESEAFVNLLLAARSSKESRLFVAITMRTDFLGSCVRFLELPDAINRAQYLTPRLTQEQMRKAIEAPAPAFGGVVDPELTADLLNELGSDSDQLPVLQHALARLWEVAPKSEAGRLQIGRVAATKVGGLQEALAKHAEAVLTSLSAQSRRAAEWLFRAITEKRDAEIGGQAIRRPQSLKQIADWSQRPWKEFVPVVKAFAHQDVSFLRYQGKLSEPEVIVDLSHEALIRKWPTLNGWVESEARRANDFRRWRDRSKSGGALLAGADLLRAVEWRDGTGAAGSERGWVPSAAWARRYRRRSQEPDPKPSQEAPAESAEVAPVEDLTQVLRYIAKSHSALTQARRREQWMQRFLFALTLGFLAAALATTFLYFREVERTDTMAATSMWSQFTFTEGKISAAEDRSLLQLARSGESVKQQFLRQIFDEEVKAQRFLQQPAVVLQAAVGTSRQMRDYLLKLSKDAPLDRTSSASSERRTARALIALQLDDPDAGPACLHAFEGVDPARLKTTTQSLREAATGLPQTQARALAESLLKELRRTTPPPLPVKVVSPILFATVGQLTDETILALATDERFQAGTLTALEDLPAERLSPLATAAFLQMSRTSESKELQTLALVLAGTAKKLPEAARRSLASRSFASIQGATNPLQRRAFLKATATFAKDLPKAERQPAARELLAALDPKQDMTDATRLGVGLAALAADVPDSEARPVANALLAVIQQTDASTDETTALGSGFAALLGKLPSALTASLVHSLLESATATEDFDLRDARLAALSALSSRLPQDIGLSLADGLLEEIKKTTELHRISDLPEVLVEVLVEVLLGLPEKARLPALDRVLASALRSRDETELDMHLAILGGIEEQLPPEQSRALLLRVMDLGKRLWGRRPGLGDRGEKLVRAAEAALPQQYSPALLNWALTELKEAEENRGDPLDDREFKVMRRIQHLPPKELAQLANATLAGMERPSGAAQNRFRTRILTIIGDKIPEPLALAAARAMLADAVRPGRAVSLEEPPSRRYSDSLRSLPAVVGRLPESAAGDFTLSILKAVRPTLASDQLRALGETLAATIRLVPEVQAPGLFRALLIRIGLSTEPSELDALGAGLAAAAAKVPVADSKDLAASTLQSLQADRDSFRVTALERALGPLGLKLGGAPELLLEILKYPRVPRAELMDVLRTRHPDAPKKELGGWAFFAWAQEKYPEVDFDAPVKSRP